jgi:2-polyprenyl-3-methyl-5-hydroxy-6-metoxy-1,4-benzoquinol methylase
MICTLCSSPLITKKDPSYYDCDNCKALIKDAKEYLSDTEEKAHYKIHNNDVHDVRYQNFTMPITSYVLDTFLPAAKGLDFGSGTGPVISSMLQKQGYDILQYDPYFAPDENVFNSTYDYIVSCEVFEHFNHPKKEIARLTSILKPNGLLLIMTLLYNDKINFNTWHYRRDPTHICIYRKETIAYIAKKYRLQIVELTDRFIVLGKTDNEV